MNIHSFFDEAHPILQMSLNIYGFSLVRRDKANSKYKVSTLKYIPVLIGLTQYPLMAGAILIVAPKLDYNWVLFVMPTLMIIVHALHRNYQVIILADVERLFYERIARGFHRQTNSLKNGIHYVTWIGYSTLFYLVYYLMVPSLLTSLTVIIVVSSVVVFYHLSSTTEDYYFQLLAEQVAKRHWMTAKHISKTIKLGRQCINENLLKIMQQVTQDQKLNSIFNKVSI